MQKIRITITVASIILLLISLTLFSLIYADIVSVGTADFDSIKWLDADLLLWQWGFNTLVAGVLLNIVLILLKLRGTKTRT
ncbi:hypothetical protein [Bavariicoccus seileri]|uniref:hypothetical protein n=1 Tax=Bavariicoccus seileri TaxID=549685 RepID=UPI0003B3D81E|nr:hypothetical protein [Bavariicoccus seileri]